MHYSLIHNINIIIHVLFGTAALLAGIIALSTLKGSSRHKKAGKYFLFFLSVIIVTALTGIFFFSVNVFLLVITMISFYQGYSGYRVIQQRDKGPALIDTIVTILTAASAAYFIYYIKSAGFIWSPVVIYSTIGWLGVFVLYDVCRYFIPFKTYRKVWMYEHIVKMTGAYTAIVSAFTGTVLPISFQPYSQVLPSAIGSVFIIALCIAYHQRISKRENVFEKDH